MSFLFAPQFQYKGEWHFVLWAFIHDSRNLSPSPLVDSFHSSVYSYPLRTMPMPPFIPPAYSSSQMTSGSYASLPRPPVGTILYDQVYNDDLMSIKVNLRNMLKNNRLSSMPMGFPFHVVYDASGRSEISHGSYDFQERFCPSDQRSRAQTVTFSYIAPSFNFNQRQRMSWRVTIPSRESSTNGMIPCTSAPDCTVRDTYFFFIHSQNFPRPRGSRSYSYGNIIWCYFHDRPSGSFGSFVLIDRARHLDHCDCRQL